MSKLYSAVIFTRDVRRYCLFMHMSSQLDINYLKNVNFVKDDEMIYKSNYSKSMAFPVLISVIVKLYLFV